MRKKLCCLFALALLILPLAIPAASAESGDGGAWTNVSAVGGTETRTNAEKVATAADWFPILDPTTEAVIEQRGENAYIKMKLKAGTPAISATSGGIMLRTPVSFDGFSLDYQILSIKGLTPWYSFGLVNDDVMLKNQIFSDVFGVIPMLFGNETSTLRIPSYGFIDAANYCNDSAARMKPIVGDHNMVWSTDSDKVKFVMDGHQKELYNFDPDPVDPANPPLTVMADDYENDTAWLFFYYWAGNGGEIEILLKNKAAAVENPAPLEPEVIEREVETGCGGDKKDSAVLMLGLALAASVSLLMKR